MTQHFDCFSGDVAGRDVVNEAPQAAASIHIGGNVAGHVFTGSTTIHISAPSTLRQRVVVPTGPEHIDETQAATLTRLVREVVQIEKQQKRQPKGFQAVWAGLNAQCGVTQYRLIRAAQFELAVTYLRQWIGRLNAMASAPQADHEAWRKRRYAFIKINTAAPAEAVWLAGYLQRYGVHSIAELADADLTRTYQAVASRKRNAARLGLAPKGP